MVTDIDFENCVQIDRNSIARVANVANLVAGGLYLESIRLMLSTILIQRVALRFSGINLLIYEQIKMHI